MENCLHNFNRDEFLSKILYLVKQIKACFEIQALASTLLES